MRYESSRSHPFRKDPQVHIDYLFKAPRMVVTTADGETREVM